MGQWDAWIGRTQVQQDRLTPSLLHRFLATIDGDVGSDSAPQGIHWCLCTPEATTAELGADGHPARTDSANSFFPPVPLPRRMWASSAVEFLAPLSVNAEIIRTSTIAAIKEKSGGSGLLVFVDVDHETLTDGVLAVRERQTLVYREASSAPAKAGAQSPPPPTSGLLPPQEHERWSFHRTLTPSETMLFRFSAITFNSHRIHYDAPYATAEEGYRGLVVHGPLMASLLLDLAAQQFGHNRLRSFAFRAQAPAFVNEPLHLVGRREGDAVTLAALGPDGQVRLAAEGKF